MHTASATKQRHAALVNNKVHKQNSFCKGVCLFYPRCLRRSAGSPRALHNGQGKRLLLPWAALRKLRLHTEAMVANTLHHMPSSQTILGEIGQAHFLPKLRN